MPYEPRPDTGTLFTNDKKTADNQPDMTGDILIAMPGNQPPKKMRIAGWWKQGQRGEFLSLRISEPQQRQQDQGEQMNDNPRRQSTQAAVRASVQPARPRPQGDPSMRQQAPRQQEDDPGNLPF